MTRPGQTSSVLLIETDATRSDDGGIVAVMDDVFTDDAMNVTGSFEPTATPEPASAGLIGLELIGLAGLRRLRRR